MKIELNCGIWVNIEKEVFDDMQIVDLLAELEEGNGLAISKLSKLVFKPEDKKKIYEALKDLPRYILTDERFWAWFNFTIGYKAALQAMPIKSDSTFGDHWLFNQGKRRGIFFNVMARCFFRVELSVDERLEDKYELTKFVIENPIRFRELTWRANSSEKHIVLGALKAEKAICEKYQDQVKSSIYKEIAKHISLYGSVRLIDVVPEEEIYNTVYSKMEEIICSEKCVNE